MGCPARLPLQGITEMSLDTRPPKEYKPLGKRSTSRCASFLPSQGQGDVLLLAGDHAKEGASHVTTCSQEEPRDALRGQAAVLKWGIEQSNQLETLVSRNKK